MRSVLDAEAPANRLAAFRIVVGVFVVTYLVGRSPVFLALADRPTADFDGVGLFGPLSSPPPDGVLIVAVLVGLVSGTATILGWRYRPNIIVFASVMLLLTTWRGSWGQLLHFENLMVLQLLVLAASPGADDWSLDARRSTSKARPDMSTPSVRYGWPLAVAGVVTVATYVIAGVAKLRYGGLDWLSGDTLQNHIAYSFTRLDLIGGNPPILGEFAVRQSWALGASAVVAVGVELAAPAALIGRRSRNVWVAAAWTMHVGIFLTMAVGFPSPLFGAAFAPFFALEKVVPWVRERTRRWRRRAAQG